MVVGFAAYVGLFSCVVVVGRFAMPAAGVIVTDGHCLVYAHVCGQVVC